MKKKLMAPGGLLLASMILANGFSTTALAAEDEVSNGGQLNSNAIITFTPDETGTNPVDPENPDPENPVGPVDPTDPEGKPEPGTNGPLSIDFASSLDFGTQEITSSNKTYYAAAQKFSDLEERPNYVQVTDNRGTESGWTLGVKQNGQFKTNDGKELTGAEVTFMNTAVTSVSDSKKPSNVATEFSLIPDGSGAMTTVMGAKVGEGAGTYVAKFGDLTNATESIKLDVPGKTTKYADKYSTSFTWTLTDVPGQ